jgi:F-type H+-transporting ATPase subunit a
VNLWRLPHFQIAPEVIYRVPGIDFPITNTLLCTWITIFILLALFFAATRRKDMVPRGIQNFMEWGVELLRGLAESVAGKKNGRRFFPLVATFFLFIIIANLLDLVPGVDSIGTIEPHKLPEGTEPSLFLLGDASNAIIPWIRPATTDLNLTLGMALIAIITAQCFGFFSLGIGEHTSKYFNFKALGKLSFVGFIEFFVGLLELVGEISRVLSLAFRLFGNIFAGSIVLAVFAFLLPVFANIVFLPFELLVAFIQAFVFSLLTLIYLQLAVISHNHHEDEHQSEGTIQGSQNPEATAAH